MGFMDYNTVLYRIKTVILSKPVGMLIAFLIGCIMMHSLTNAEIVEGKAKTKVSSTTPFWIAGIILLLSKPIYKLLWKIL